MNTLLSALKRAAIPAILIATIASANAQQYPNRPIRVISPYPAGSASDTVTRVVMELAATAGLKVSESNLTRYDLFNANECFLTGTAAELMPVVKIDGRVIGAGTPGPVTGNLMTEYHALTKASGQPIYE